MKTAAMRKGVLFVEAEPLEFLYDETVTHMVEMKGFRNGEYQPCTEVVVSMFEVENFHHFHHNININVVLWLVAQRK